MKKLENYSIGDYVKFRLKGEKDELPYAGTIVYKQDGRIAVELNDGTSRIYELTENDVIVQIEEMELNNYYIIQQCKNKIIEWEKTYCRDYERNMLIIEDMRESMQVLKDSIQGCRIMGLLSYNVCEILESQMNEIMKEFKEKISFNI